LIAKQWCSSAFSHFLLDRNVGLLPLFGDVYALGGFKCALRPVDTFGGALMPNCARTPPSVWAKVALRSVAVTQVSEELFYFKSNFTCFICVWVVARPAPTHNVQIIMDRQHVANH
jgi:protein gp37